MPTPSTSLVAWVDLSLKLLPARSLVSNSMFPISLLLETTCPFKIACPSPPLAPPLAPLNKATVPLSSPQLVDPNTWAPPLRVNGSKTYVCSLLDRIDIAARSGRYTRNPDSVQANLALARRGSETPAENGFFQLFGVKGSAIRLATHAVTPKSGRSRGVDRLVLSILWLVVSATRVQADEKLRYRPSEEAEGDL